MVAGGERDGAAVFSGDEAWAVVGGEGVAVACPVEEGGGVFAVEQGHEAFCADALELAALGEASGEGEVVEGGVGGSVDVLGG